VNAGGEMATLDATPNQCPLCHSGRAQNREHRLQNILRVFRVTPVAAVLVTLLASTARKISSLPFFASFASVPLAPGCATAASTSSGTGFTSDPLYSACLLGRGNPTIRNFPERDFLPGIISVCRNSGVISKKRRRNSRLESSCPILHWD
jgi:hypothetical protein